MHISDSLYAYSSRSFQIDGYTLPYAWNHTIRYDPEYGTQPYLVQSLQTDDITIDYDISKEVLRYQLAAIIGKGRSTESFFLYCIIHYCRDPMGKVLVACQMNFVPFETNRLLHVFPRFPQIFENPGSLYVAFLYLRP